MFDWSTSHDFIEVNFTRLSKNCGQKIDYYFKYFRMSPQRFDDLLGRVSSLISHSKTHRMPVSPSERLALTLRLLATGDDQQSLAFAYRLGRSTVNVIFRETCAAIWKALTTDFVPVPSMDDWKEIANGFEKYWNFPNCLGSVDGKHVQIKVSTQNLTKTCLMCRVDRCQSARKRRNRQNTQKAANASTKKKKKRQNGHLRTPLRAIDPTIHAAGLEQR